MGIEGYLVGIFEILVLFLRSLLFFQIRTPLSLGARLLCLNLAVCAYLAVTRSTWFALILFLIYIRAIMVLFLYICLVSSNQNFSPISNMTVVAWFFLLYFSFFSYRNFSFVSFSIITQKFLEEVNLSLFIRLVTFLFLLLLAIVLICGKQASLRARSW